MPLAVAYVLRGFLEKRFVVPRRSCRRSLAQFRLELALYTAAGFCSALIMLVLHDFPLMQSGMKLVLGIFTVGVFAGLDAALWREQAVIREALAGGAIYDPPERFTPLTRRFSLVSVSVLLLVTVILLLVVFRDVQWLAGRLADRQSIRELGQAVFWEIVFVMGLLIAMVINLVLAYSRNLNLLFRNQTRVLERVSLGDLTRLVPVATTDELGFIAGHTNRMIGALRDRSRMREGLRIAQEVQQHFLPDAPPEVPGLQLAGISRFSDETGGDFYDFIGCDDIECGRLAVAVGDVSGHGIGAALLMAAGRAVVRQGAAMPGSPSRNISLANRHLARDLTETGRFMTLFFLILDPAHRSMVWINAGHQPPLLYDPGSDSFRELRGEDIPLGVEESWQYHEHWMDYPTDGQVLLLGTDGAWEARNAKGEMFGNARIREIVRANARAGAQEILEAVSLAVRKFRGAGEQEDDVTLVVIRADDPA